MFNKSIFTVLFFSALLVLSCSGNRDSGPAAASMEQLHAENGVPVSVRELKTEDFSVFLRYPAIVNASLESTAYASLNDVVRTISVNVGDTVRQNDTIVSFSSDNQILQQATLANQNARTTFERASFLFRSNDISRQDFDTIRMQHELSTTNFRAANDMVYVKAPISGTITQIHVRPTENVRPGTPLFTVSNSNAFEARLYVGINEIERIQVGARAFIEIPRGRQTSQNLEGRVTQVSLSMDSQKQSFPVTVSFDGRDIRLASGQNVDIIVETYRNENAIVLSQREIVPNGIGPAAFIIEDNKLRKIAIKTGEENGLYMEVIGGLNEGDIIVSEGAQQINTDSRVNIVPTILSTGLSAGLSGE